MRRRTKTAALLQSLFLCLFLLGTFPCVVCPSVANATQSTEHDCCPESGKDIPAQPDNSCCVISGYCAVATVPALQADLPLQFKVHITPTLGFVINLGIDESHSLHNSLSPFSTSPPIQIPSTSRRLALLQQFLI